MLKISLIPDNPMMFLGKPFAIQINITNYDSQVLWVSAQIAGKVRSLKPTTEASLKGLVHDALGAPQNAPFFGHVMSGSRLVAAKFTRPKTFCAFITAEGIPPSYEGEGVSISYELRFAAQLPGKPVHSISVPIRFISPHKSHFVLEKTQATATFDIEAIEGETFPGLALACPFVEQPNNKEETFPIETGTGELVSRVTLAREARAGSEVSCVIDFKESHWPSVTVHAQLQRIEIYESSGINEVTCIGEAKMATKSIILRRFSIPLPFTTPADFTTDMFSVSYKLHVRFTNGTGDSVEWSTPIAVFPPQVSLSTPRKPM